MGVAEDIEIAGDAGIFQRQAGGIDAEPLPRLHLALVGALGDLLVEIERHHRVDGIGRHEVAVDDRLRLLRLDHRLPMGVEALAEARGQADAGDPDLTRHSPHQSRACAASLTGMSGMRRWNSSRSTSLGQSVEIITTSASAATSSLTLTDVSAIEKPEPSWVTLAFDHHACRRA